MMKVYGRVSFAVKRVEGLDFWIPPPPLGRKGKGYKCSLYLMKRGERNCSNESNESFFWLERKK